MRSAVICESVCAALAITTSPTSRCGAIPPAVPIRMIRRTPKNRYSSVA